METNFSPSSHSDSVAARERMLSDLRTLATDAEALIRATAENVGDKAKEARARVIEAVAKAKSHYDTLQAEGIHSVKAAAMKTDHLVRGHPYESVGIAFGLGVVVGAMLGRR